MEPQQCELLVNELQRAGFGGGYLHTRFGMLIPFLGEQYLQCVKACVRQAQEDGISAGLYDEDRWPSGWAGGAVPRVSPSYRLKALLRRPSNQVPPKDCKRIARVGGIDYFVWTMPLGHPKFSGACYTDLTNADAVREFLLRAYEPLREAVGHQFGKISPAMFTDEPALTYLYSWPEGGLPWSDSLPERIQAEVARPLENILVALFEDALNASALRLVYYRLCAQLFEESYMQQLSAWCSRHGIALTGHFMYEHSLPLHFAWGVNGHRAYQHFQWPGVDHLGRQIGEVVTAVGCRSAVHQFEKPRMMSELYGASGQHLSFADRKWIAEQQIVLGANHLVPHIFQTTLAGPRKRDYPPTLSPHQPWWPVNDILESHCGRLCQMMSKGSGEPDLLVIHPQESVFALSSELTPVGNVDSWLGRFFHPAPSAELAEIDRNWKALCHGLLDVGYVFDFGDEGILEEHASTKRADGEPIVRVGAASYRAVLIPNVVTLRRSTVDLLTNFLEIGGTVACVAHGPEMIDGDSGDEAAAYLDRFLSRLSIQGDPEEQTIKNLIKTSPPAVEIMPGQDGRRGRIWRYTRVLGDQRITFLVNLDRLISRTPQLKWRCPPRSSTFVWYTERSHAEPMEMAADRLCLDLAPGGSCAIFQNTCPDILPVPVREKRTRDKEEVLHVEGLHWKVRRLDPNTMILDQAKWRIDGQEWTGPHPLLAIKDYLDRQRYDGHLDLHFSFAATMNRRRPDSLGVILENVEDSPCQLSFNNDPVDMNSTYPAPWPDPHWRVISLDTSSIQKTNSLNLYFPEFHFGDPAEPNELPRRTGSEVEALMLVGDFAVFGNEVLGPQQWSEQLEYHTHTPLCDWLPRQRLRYLGEPLLMEVERELDQGDVTRQGLPFYAGRLAYTAEWTAEKTYDCALLLRMKELLGPVATVSVNGRSAGSIAWAPWQVDIGPFIQPGKNEIEITLFHSLRNLLGPHHHPWGEPAYVTPDSFRPAESVRWLEALESEIDLPGWREDYCLVQFGLRTD